MSRATWALAVGFGLGLLAGCANFEADFQSFCSRQSCAGDGRCCDGWMCLGGTCVAAQTGEKLPDGGTATCVPACSGSTPFCGADGVCKSCIGTQGCAAPRFCDSTGSGSCVECVDNSQCASAVGKFCHPLKKTCVECVDNSVCNNGQTCNVPNGNCELGGSDAGYPAAARLELTGGPSMMIAGVCSNPWTIRAFDSANNPTAIGGNVTLAGQGNARFFTTPMCMGSSTSLIAVPPGNSQANFYLRMEQAGPNKDIAASTPAGAQGSATVSVVASTPAYLTVSPSLLVPVGVCSGAVDVRAYDGFGNPAVLSGNVTLSSSGLSTTFYSMTGCPAASEFTTQNMTGSAASYYFVDNTQGSKNHTASAVGLDAGTVTHLVGGAAAQLPTQILFATVPPLTTAGICSPPFRITLADATNQPAAFAQPTTLSFTSSTSGDLKAYRGKGCAALDELTTIPAGATSVDFYLFTAKSSGAYNLKIDAGGVTATTSINVVPNVPRKLSFSNMPQYRAVNACINAQVGATDEYGNPTNAEVSLISDQTSTTWFGQPNCSGAGAQKTTVLTIPTGSAQASFSFRDTGTNVLYLDAQPGGASPSITDGDSARISLCKSALASCASNAECCSNVCSGSFKCQ